MFACGSRPRFYTRPPPPMPTAVQGALRAAHTSPYPAGPYYGGAYGYPRAGHHGGYGYYPRVPSYNPAVAAMPTSWERELGYARLPAPYAGYTRALPPAAEFNVHGSNVKPAPPQPAVVTAAVAEARRTDPYHVSRTAWEREVDFLREIQYADTRLPYYPDPTLPGAYDDLACAEVPGYGPMYGPHLPHYYDEAHLTEVRQITRDLDRMWVR